MSRLTNAGLASAAVAAIICGAAPAEAQQQTGVLAGTIVTPDGTPVQGATVTLSGAANIGGDRVETTDDEGEFRFLQLLPGDYEVTIKSEGYQASSRTLRVGLGGTTRLAVKLQKPSAETAGDGDTEVIEVSAEKLAVDTQRVDVGTTLDATFLQALPTARDYLSVLQFAPGVSGTGNPNMHGGSANSNQYLVDGVNTTDPTTNTFSMNFNYDAIEELEILTGGFHPRYGNVSGGVINIVTKSGSNEFKLDSSVYYEGRLLQVDAPDEQLIPEDKRRDFWSVGANLNVGGPIIEDRLWYYFSTEYNYSVSQNPSQSPIPDLDGLVKPERVFQSLYWLLKLTGQIDRHNRIQVMAHADPTTIDNSDQDITSDPSTETFQAQGGFSGKVEWDADYDPILIKVRAAYKRSLLDVFPQERVDSSSPFTVPGVFGFGDLATKTDFGLAPGCLAPGDRADGETGEGCTRDIQASASFGQGLRYDLSTGVYYGGSGTDVQILRERTDATAEVTYLLDDALGDHRIDVGFQLTFKSDESTNRDPGGASIFVDEGRNDDGTPIPYYARIVSTEDNELTQTAKGQVYAAYIADRWTIIDQVTLEPGVRIEKATHENYLGEPVLDFLTISPRIGFAVDPFGDGRTRIHGGYARLYESGYLGLSKFVGTSLQTRLTFWDPEAGRYVEDPGFVRIQGGEAGTTIDEDNIEPLYTDEFRIGIERAFDEYLSAGISYMHRKTHNAWEDDEINLIWDQAGEAIIGSRAGDGQQVFNLTTLKDAYRVYDSVELHFNRGSALGWGLNGSYTLQWSEGTTEDYLTAGFDNYRQNPYLYGPLPDDLRHMVKLQTYYAWDFGLTLGAVYRFESGSPYSAFYRDTENESFALRRAPRGRHPGNDINDPEDDRFLRVADFTRLDLRVGWNFEQLTGQKLSVSADIFNALNLGAVTGVYNRVHEDGESPGPDFGEPTGYQSPFRVQLGIRYQY